MDDDTTPGAAGGAGGVISSYPTMYDYRVSTSANDISISRPYGTLHIAQAIEELQKRLCILEPDFKKMEKYPALKEAYDNYKLVESLISERNDRD